MSTLNMALVSSILLAAAHKVGSECPDAAGKTTIPASPGRDTCGKSSPAKA